MLERNFQASLIREIKARFSDVMIVKNDPNYLQGFPDLTVLFPTGWALLETKRESKASHRPNQDYYVQKGNSMSFARFVSPENKEEVLNELQQTFQP